MIHDPSRRCRCGDRGDVGHAKAQQDLASCCSRGSSKEVKVANGAADIRDRVLAIFHGCLALFDEDPYHDFTHVVRQAHHSPCSPCPRTQAAMARGPPAAAASTSVAVLSL